MEPILTSHVLLDLICEACLRNLLNHSLLTPDFVYRRTYTTKLVKTGKDKSLDRKKPVLVERRIINHKGIHTHTEVDVKSQQLRDILIDLNKEVEGLSLKKEPPFVRLAASY